MSRTIFVSHDSNAVRQANEFAHLLQVCCSNDVSLFLSSDWHSLDSGGPWFQGVVRALCSCEMLIALITSRETFLKPWINFEVGAFVGRGLKPKIFVFGRILPWEGIPRPLADLKLTDTGNTNR